MPRKDNLNYAKWDHIGDDDDDDDESSEDDTSRRPRVTRLDKPSTITTSSDGSITCSIDQANHPQSLSQTEITTTSPEEASSRTAKTKQAGVPTSWTEKGAFVDHSSASKSHKSKNRMDDDAGDDDDDDNTTATRRLSYYWSQDRLSVNVRILLLDDHEQHMDQQPQRWNCAVENILPYRDRQAAVMGSSAPQRLLVTCNGKILLQGHLSHPVHLAEEEDAVDWSIEQYSDDVVYCRYLLLTLYKATPFAGMAIWWKKVLQEEDHEIPLDWVQSSGAFQQSWDEAHKQFRANLENKTQHSV